MERFFLFGDLWDSWIWISKSLPRFGKFSATVSLNKLYASFSFRSPVICKCFSFFSMYLIDYKGFLHSFYYSSLLDNFKVLSSNSQIFFFSAWTILLLMSSFEFFISFTVFFSSIIWLFLSLLNFCFVHVTVFVILLNHLSVFLLLTEFLKTAILIR